MNTATDSLEQGLQHLMLDLRQMKNFCEHPLIMARGEGIYCYDIHGKRYIEGVSGIYVTNIGHGNRHVIDAIREQQEKISFAGPLHAVSDIAVRYAQRLARITPSGMSSIKLLTGGSEATESAIKFARQYHVHTGNPGKYKVNQQPHRIPRLDDGRHVGERPGLAAETSVRALSQWIRAGAATQLPASAVCREQ